MEPLDWQKAGFEPDHKRDRLLAQQQAIRKGLANSRLPEYPTEEAKPTRAARAFIKEHEATHGVMGVDYVGGEGEHREWPLDAGIPTDYSEPTRQFNEEGVKAAGHNKLSNTMLGIAVANILTAPERGIDMVTLPAHYARYVIEPIRFISENKLDFFQGNIVKYIVRHDAKNGIEDIDKVIRYAQMYRKFLQKDPDWWK